MQTSEALSYRQLDGKEELSSFEFLILRHIHRLQTIPFLYPKEYLGIIFSLSWYFFDVLYQSLNYYIPNIFPWLDYFIYLIDWTIKIKLFFQSIKFMIYNVNICWAGHWKFHHIYYRYLYLRVWFQRTLLNSQTILMF